MHTSVKKESSGLQDIVQAHLERFFSMHKEISTNGSLYETIINEVEKPLFLQTLLAVGGNQTKAAKLLGINRNTLRKRLIALGISDEKAL